jgi:subtilase family serine protease
MAEEIEMMRWRPRLPTIALMSIAALTLVLALLISVPATAGGAATSACGAGSAAPSRVTLIGHLIPALSHLKPLHPTNCARVLHLAIALKLRDQAGLNNFLAAVNDPHSPLYHHYLSPQDLAARFGPLSTTLDSITAYLRGHGFTNITVATNHLMIDATATVATVERAFGVNIADFSFGGRVVFAPTNEPSAPVAFARALLQVSGLDDMAPGVPAR